MTDREELSENLGLAFEHIKALHATLSAVMVAIAAFSNSVLKALKTSRAYCRSLASEVAKRCRTLSLLLLSQRRHTKRNFSA
jgi:hypothetical protein